MIVRLGHIEDGRSLGYDERLYEFRLETATATYDEVAAFENRGQIRWHAMEQRDWFRRIDPAALQACNQRALQEATYEIPEAMNPYDQVKTDAARDDSILAGKIVDADPALVQAVMDELEKKGMMMGPGMGGDYQPNPLAMANLPRGMEALSQFERSQGADRKMTRSEERLMKKILKHDDREKLKREKEADAIQEANEKQEEKDKKKREQATGADGNIDVEGPNEEELALLEMRQRNAQEASRMYTTQRVFSSSGVPTGGRSLGTNPDGSPKQGGVVAFVRKRKQLKDEEKQLNKRMGKKGKRRRKGKKPDQDEEPPDNARGNYADGEQYAANSNMSGGGQGGMGDGMGGPGGGGQGGMMGGGGMGGGPGGGMGGGMGGGNSGVLGLIQNILNIVQQVLRIFGGSSGGGMGGGGMR